MKIDVIPEKLGSPINYSVLLLIGAIIVIFHIVVNISKDSDTIVSVFSMIIPATVSAFGFITARRYAGTLVYSRAYTMLGIAFLLMFSGEFTYFVYDQILKLDPYPSIADLFFFVFYPMVLLYLITNMRFFAPQITKIGIITIVGTPLVTTFVYLYLSLSDFGSFDFYYGVIFVAAASTTLGFSIHTARIFRGGLIGTAWLVLVIGIILDVVGDTWYYYLEINNGYTLENPVNLCWYSSYLLILYSLYKHKKSL